MSDHQRQPHQQDQCDAGNDGVVRDVARLAERWQRRGRLVRRLDADREVATIGRRGVVEHLHVVRRRDEHQHDEPERGHCDADARPAFHSRNATEAVTTAERQGASTVLPVILRSSWSCSAVTASLEWVHDRLDRIQPPPRSPRRRRRACVVLGRVAADPRAPVDTGDPPVAQQDLVGRQLRDGTRREADDEELAVVAQRTQRLLALRARRPGRTRGRRRRRRRSRGPAPSRPRSTSRSRPRRRAAGERALVLARRGRDDVQADARDPRRPQRARRRRRHRARAATGPAAPRPGCAARTTPSCSSA